jgi:hypothetical protein
MVVNKFTRLLLCAMVASSFVLPTPATASAPVDQKTLTICISLKTGYQLISKTGKCNERIYETRTWFQKGSAPSGTPGSKLIDLATCISKSSGLQIIRTRLTCNSITTTTALWQRPLGPPVAPSMTSVVMGLLGTATINIAPPAEDGGARITSYLVTSSPAAVAATFTPVQIKAAKITGLTSGSTYSFSVVAINSKGSSPSSIASAPALAPTIPNAPGITKVVATGTNSAQLTFTAPLDNGGSPITSFVATSNPGSLQTTVYQSDGGTINITNLSHSTSYTFSLKAINAAGSSLPSSTSPSITTATPPPPPEPVAVAPSAPIDTVISVATIVGVTGPATGATPVNTTTAGTGYTGTVTWSGSPANFAAATTYTATITLTPTSGYTLTGVSENFFTVAGATTDTNPANSGVITAVFPATAAGAAAKVAITRASVGTQRRTAFTTQPQITVQDSAGNTITSSSAVVTATVSASGTFVGTTTATASSGVATFTSLGVDGTIGTTYTITYTVSGLAVATATVALTGITCDGTTFTCQVGDTGPGGGKIFYVASTFFTQESASGSMCTTNCKYLEAAPNTWGVGGSSDPTRTWATNVNSNQTTTVTGADGTAIGTGYKNSIDIVAQTGNVAESSAAVLARSYNSILLDVNYQDWFLPSKDELAQLYAQKTTVGGFVALTYWSSSEYSNDYAWAEFFNNGSKSYNGKHGTGYVRPVRAFGPAPIVISVAAIAGVTAPVIGATPVTTTTAGTGYTGAVTWASSGGALGGNFASATTYTATITLTAASGYTLTGVTANFFTVAGATTDTNSANSGVITAVFPATASKVAITTASVGTQRRTAFTTQPQITVQDSGGSTVTSSSAVVTATVSDGGTLVGTTTATASSGVATFTGLGVNGTIGTTYTITYTVTGLTVATATVTLTGTTCNGSFTCQVGDTGPGGGIVYYVSAAYFTSTGSTCNATCKYLEAASTTATRNPWTDATYAWSGNTSVSIGATAQGTAIGTGYANTLAIVRQSGGGDTASRAGTISKAYGGPNDLTDWFLPSRDELNQMCKWEKGVAWTSDATVCTGGTLNTGSGAAGFVNNYYSSSSERFAADAWLQTFNSGVQDDTPKSTLLYVRPVRVF